MWPEFFLQTLLGLVITEVWDFTVDKIKKVYKEHKDVPEGQKTFQSRMYTAIIDAFCAYTGINPDEAQDDVMDFIYLTAKEYFDQSYKNQDTTTDALVSAIKTLESRFDNTLLDKENTENINKVLFISDYIQRYIAKDQEFRHIYVVEALEYLRRIGVQIKENQLDLKLFAEEAINKAEHRLAVLIVQNSDRVIDEIKQDNKKQTDELKQDNREQIREQTKVILSAIDKSSQHDNTEEKIYQSEEKPKFKDAKEMYAKKWKDRLFLHRRPEDDDLTLEKTFVAPAYYLLNTSVFQPNLHFIEEITYLENEKANDLEAYDNLKEALDQFIIDGRSMLILGQPGMGKSSIVCYLAGKYINDPQLLIVKFKDLNIKKSTDQNLANKSLLLDSIINYFHCDKNVLENKTLILDGYDEIDSYFFNIDLFSDFFLSIREIINFKILITSRENYIIKETQYFEKIIVLLPFDAGKIEKFAEHITHDKRVPGYIVNNDNNKVFGIPVILYMALATGVDLSKSVSRTGVYNKIFSLNGGIFDRFYSQHNDSYEIGSHTISYVKNAFYNILCNTAFYMFENFSDNSIPQNAYEKIIEDERTKAKELLAKSSELDSPLWYDFPIGNLYEKTDSISFIHKSFYEYFAAEYFFAAIYSISKDIIKRNLYDNENKEEHNKIISRLSNLFSQNTFSVEIIEYLQYKINANFCNDEIEILRKFYIYIFKKMLARGMTYKLSQSIKHSTLQTECVIFANMLDFIHLWIKYNVYPYIKFGKIEIDQISIYLKLWSLVNLPCTRGVFKVIDPYSSTRLNLSYFNLDGINLKYISLINIDFKHSSLNNSDLDYITIMDSDLKDTEFISSSLIGANFSGSFFRETNFLNANISNAKFENSTVPGTIFDECIAKNTIFKNVTAFEEASYTHELDDAIFE